MEELLTGLQKQQHQLKEQQLLLQQRMLQLMNTKLSKNAKTFSHQIMW